MLAAIGITLILKQLPHLVAYDADFFGDDAFFQSDGHNTFTEIFYSFRAFQPGAVIIGAASLFILIAYEKFKLNNTKLFKFIPGALLVVLFAFAFSYLNWSADYTNTITFEKIAYMILIFLGVYLTSKSSSKKTV